MSQILVLIYQDLYNHSLIIRSSSDWIHINETSIECVCIIIFVLFLTFFLFLFLFVCVCFFCFVFVLIFIQDLDWEPHSIDVSLICIQSELLLDGPLPKLCPVVVLSPQDGCRSAVALLLKTTLIQVSDYRLLGASGFIIGSHLGGRARLPDTILEEDHPMTIPSKLVFMWISHRVLSQSAGWRRTNVGKRS
jgi:hypothetical protein